MSDESDPLQSDYCYPGTRVLKNKLEIRDVLELSRAERRFSAAALVQLGARPIHGDFGLDHYLDIHRAVVGGIYEWAGKVRGEDIQKGASVFGHHRHVGAYFNQVSAALRGENYLRDVPDRDAFATRAADYYAVINYAHPAREGNGRTTREYMRTLAMNAGYELSWSGLDSDMLNASCRAAMPREGRRGPTSGLVTVLRDGIRNELPRQDLRDAWDALKRPAPPAPEWRGTLGEAVLEAQRRAAGPVAFVSAAWPEHVRVRVQSPVELAEVAAKAAERWPTSHGAPVYGLGPGGTIRNTMTRRDEYLLVSGRDTERYPTPLKEALDRHFGKATPVTPVTPARGPDIDGP